MTKSSDRLYRLALTQSEFLTLNHVLEKGLEKMRTHTMKKGGVLGEVPIENSDIKNLKAIYTRTERMVEMDLCTHQDQPTVDMPTVDMPTVDMPTVDMATVNLAFNRIREALEALADADLAINSHKEV